MAHQQSSSQRSRLSKPSRQTINIYPSRSHRYRQTIDVSSRVISHKAVSHKNKIRPVLDGPIPKLAPVNPTASKLAFSKSVSLEPTLNQQGKGRTTTSHSPLNQQDKRQAGQQRAGKQRASQQGTTTSDGLNATKRVRVVAIAGTTATVAAAGAIQAFTSPPTYEGHIQLVGILPTTTSTVDRTTATGKQTTVSPELAAELANANIAPPSLINAVQSSMLNDPQMAVAVTNQLKQKGIVLNSRDLLDQLKTKTSPEGWLELHYQNTNPEHVHHVLEHIAKWYVSQDTSCEIQACRDITFIEAQIPILQQQQDRLERSIAALNQVTQTGEEDSAPATALSVEEQADHLSVQVKEQARQISQLEDAMTEALTHLDYLQSEMNLDNVEIHTGFALLHQVIPNYQAWLAEWQHHDLQQIATSLLASTSTSASTSASTQSTKAQAIAGQQQAQRQAQQQTRLDQMNAAVRGLADQALLDMPLVIQDLILADSARFGPMADWLQTLHTLQLLELRRQNFTQLNEVLITQSQEWKQRHQTQDQLQRDLVATTESLSAYQNRYTVVQHQVAKQQLTWQMVAPPEVVQQAGILWSLSRPFSGDANPLMALQSHFQ